MHFQRSVTKEYPRGSMEETRRILEEIDRINLSLGYKKRMSLAFPRVASGEGYFYPRQQFRPEFLTKPRENFDTIRMNNRRAINPFNNQNYYYPAPYLQVPMGGKAQAFKANNYVYPLIYAPINALPYDFSQSRNADKDSDGSIRLGTIVVLPTEEQRNPKSLPEEKKTEKKGDKNKKKPTESSFYDDIVNIVPDALGFNDDDDDERQESIVSTTRLPAIKNDKFLNLALKKHPQEQDDDDDARKNPSVKNTMNRAFNFSNPIEKIQNFTKQFQINHSGDHAKEVNMETTSAPTPSAEDLEEAEEEKKEDLEDQKSPFGFGLAFGPQSQLENFKKGGLIIQRLKVRRGGIAIAGPGGVATVNLLFSRLH